MERVNRRLVCWLVALVLTALPALARDGIEMVMVEQDGCAYCQRWDAEIGPVYPKTPEGALAPLRRVDLRAPVPDDLSFSTRVVFTPTFILTRDGAEIARIEGYAGDEMFWWMLARMLRDEGLEPGQ